MMLTARYVAEVTVAKVRPWHSDVTGSCGFLWVEGHVPSIFVPNFSNIEGRIIVGVGRGLWRGDGGLCS